MLFFFSSTEVTARTAVRPNQRRIKSLHTSTDSKTNGNSQSHTQNNYKLQIVSELVLLCLVVVVPLSVKAGFFADWFGGTQKATSTLESMVVMDGPADISLLAALQNPDPLAGRGGAELIVDEDALVSTGPIGEDEIAEQSINTGEIRVYTVREGDSLSMVAEMFGVTTNTIMWANDIPRATAIQPGDTLVILPIAGVRHIVKSGDTISTIAKKYEGDVEEILSYNQLESGSDLSVGDTLIIPGGAMHASAPARRSAAAAPTSVSGSVSGGSFTHPAPGAMRTQGIHGYNAVDLAGGYGSPIRSAAAGEVIIARASGWNGGYGNYVVIRHSNGTQTLYAHLSSVYVGVGQYVGQAETIGGMGSTGRSTGTHLHFEVRGGRNPF